MAGFLEIVQIYNSNGGTKRLIRKKLITQVYYDISMYATVIVLYNGDVVYAEDDYEDIKNALCEETEN